MDFTNPVPEGPGLGRIGVGRDAPKLERMMPDIDRKPSSLQRGSNRPNDHQPQRLIERIAVVARKFRFQHVKDPQ